jgi:hypothetical protein
MTVNEALIRAAGNMILAFPENWDQAKWCSATEENHEPELQKNFCGTSFCLAGWGAYLAGYVRTDGKLTKQGRTWAQERYDGYTPVGLENRDWTKLGEEIFGLYKEGSYYEETHPLFLAGTREPGFNAAEMMRVIEEKTGVVVAPALAGPVPQGLNVPLLRAVVAMIEAYPENWNQGAWSRSQEDQDNPPKTLCGTQFCLAGWTTTLVGYNRYNGKLGKSGKALLQLRLDRLKKEGKPSDVYQINYLERSIEANQMNDGLWERLASEALGTNVSEIFAADYASTVEELKRKLTAQFNVTF